MLEEDDLINMPPERMLWKDTTSTSQVKPTYKQCMERQYGVLG